jgi:hypothetical protein
MMTWVGYASLASLAVNLAATAATIVQYRRGRARLETAKKLVRLVPRLTLHAAKMHQLVDALTHEQHTHTPRCVACRAGYLLEHLDDPDAPGDPYSNAPTGNA